MVSAERRRRCGWGRSQGRLRCLLIFDQLLQQLQVCQQLLLDVPQVRDRVRAHPLRRDPDACEFEQHAHHRRPMLDQFLESKGRERNAHQFLGSNHWAGLKRLTHAGSSGGCIHHRAGLDDTQAPDVGPQRRGGACFRGAVWY